MIVSVNPKPTISEFSSLMHNTDCLLNEDARKRPAYYRSHTGNLLEDVVKDALCECAKGTAFAGTIEKVSGQRFPDIVAAKFYGVEVKSTKEDHWTSTGSSILETTRISDVERIYMTFGKLGGVQPEFCSKPYEACLHGIAVTHMPRYLINMRLQKGETIFDKMGISYDELRNMDNPIAPVSEYYRKRLKPGESLWWAGNAADEVVEAKIRLWKNLSSDEKKRYVAYCCANFPEIFAGDYDRCSLWLTSQGVVNPHIRDMFSAGGKIEIEMPNGIKVLFPGIYKRIIAHKDDIILELSKKEPELPLAGKELTTRVLQWCGEVSNYAAMDYHTSMDGLSMVIYGVSVDVLRNTMCLHE